MPEPTKTILFVAAAALSVALAIFTRPSTSEYDPSDQLGTDIAPPFDPDEAKRLSITRFDEETATVETFEVAERDGLWTLPSKGGYPADAARQLAEAINGVTDREILLVASEDARDHAEFGVVDPASPKLEPGQTGVGARVALSKDSGDKLVDIIIGKEVKDADNQRYVRRGEQDVVFVAEIDPTSFSTDFSKWIEDDLLKVSPWDIRRVSVDDYSAELFLTLQGLGADTTYRSRIELGYDDEESKWSLESLATADDPKAQSPSYSPVAMTEDQELDEDKLNEFKNALDDLRIVDVSRKPEGLSANLKAGEDFMKDQTSLRSLITRGFAPTRNEAGELDLLCSEGEVVCTMKDGVEYVLRFGNLELDEGEQEADAGEDSEASDEKASGVNRYLFVMARFNEDTLQRPELEEVPPLPEGASEKDVDAAEESSDSEGEDNGEAAEEAPESELDKAVAERKAVEQRNSRLLDEHEEKLKAGRERVSELNARFGDWYYVVPDEVFQKIRLGRDDVIKQKEAEASEEGDDAADESAPGASAFGAPGGAIPGLPGLDGGMEEESSAEEQAPAEGAAEEKPVTEEAATEETSEAADE